MDQIIQTLIIGLANGLIYALVALGYTLVYGIIELITSPMATCSCSARCSPTC